MLKVYRLRFKLDPSGRHGFTIDAVEWVRDFDTIQDVRASDPLRMHEEDVLQGGLPTSRMEHREGNWQLIVLSEARGPRIVAVENIGEWHWLPDLDQSS
jgi:hypothetical protein